MEKKTSQKSGRGRLSRLRPEQARSAKEINHLVEFPAENPYPVMRIARNSTVIYSNQASSPILRQWRCERGQQIPGDLLDIVTEVLNEQKPQETELECEGKVYSLTFAPVKDTDFVNVYGLDITTRKQSEEEREVMIKLLSLINSSNKMRELMKLVLVFLKDWSGCEAIGIRLQDGEDFPYYVTSGFTDEFIQAENKLCSVNEIGELVRDSQGRPFLECMCGNVISSRFDPSKPFFTKHGSFWTNSTTRLLASTTEADRLATTRNRCNTAGYESVALIPLRAANNTFGLLQFNDKRKGCFTPDRIALFERLADNLAIGLAQRKAEQALQEQKEVLQTILDNIPVMIAFLDSNGKHKWVNEAWEQTLGWTLREAQRRDVLKEFYPDDKYRQYVFDFIATAQSKWGDFRTRRRDGTVLDTCWASVPLSDGSNIGIGLDITDRKKAEQALKKAESEKATILNTMSELVAYQDAEHRVLWANRAACESVGSTAEKLLGRYCYEIWQGRNKPCVNCPVERAWKTGRLETEEIQGSGGKVWSIRANPVKNEAGNVIGVVEVTSDIAERKKMAEALRQSEKKYRTVVESSLDAIFVHDHNGRYLYINDAGAKFYGKKPAEVIGRTLEKLLPKEQAESLLKDIRRVHRGGKVLRSEYTIPFGERICHFSTVLSPISDESGNTVSVLGMGHDITDRKRAEEAMRESENLIRQVLNAVPFPIFAKDRDGRYILVNKADAELHSTTPEAMVGKTDFDYARLSLASEQEVERFLADDRMVIDSKQPKFILAETLTMPDGTTRWFQTTKIPVSLQGNPDCVLGIAVDITERKKAEEELAESEKHYRMLTETINDGLGELDESGRYVYVNRKLGEILGYSPDEMIGRHWSQFYDLNAQEIVSAQLTARKEGFSEPYEVATTRKDGRKVYIRISPQVLFDEYGKFKGSLGILTDVTERKQTEENLKKSQEELSQIVQGNSIPTFVIDDQHVLMYWNRACENLTGFSAGDMVGTKRQWRAFYDKERPVMADLIADNASKNEIDRYYKGRCRRSAFIEDAYEAEDFFPSLGKDGKWLLFTAAPLRDTEGKLIGVIETMQDVTERKQAEESLRASEARYRSYIDVTSDIAWVTDANGNVVEDIPSFRKFTGQTYEQAKGSGWTKALHPDDVGRTLAVWRRAVSTKSDYAIEYRMRRCDGKYRYLLARGVPVINKSGSVQEWVGTCTDITERRQAEENMIVYQNKLKSLASQLALSEEQNRRGIAAELHDHVGQALAFARLELDTVRQAASQPELAAKLQNVSKSILNVIDDLHTLSFDLSSPVLRECGLEAAISDFLSERLKKISGLQGRFIDDGQQKPLDEDVKAIMFRSVRELVTNVIKHARASKLKITAKLIDNKIQVVIKDNGVGFDATKAADKAARRETFGLFSIEEQLGSLGGELRIFSEPGEGTTAVLTAPIKKD